MHDLLQNMAFDIVRLKKGLTSRDPGKCSRLGDIEEVCDVFKNSKGKHKVEGIMFDLSQKGDLHVRADTFNIMTKLRFLRLYVPLSKKISTTIYHPEDMMPFSEKLRYLEWSGWPLKSLPHPFCAELLVEIHLPHSNVKYLWLGMQELVYLEKIDLRESKQLMKLPDLSGAKKLKWLYLSGCESLCEVQPSIFSKDTLVTLLVDRCKKLKILDSGKHLRSLQKIDVSGCSSLREFSLSSDSIEELDLSNTGIEILHSSIGRLNKLRKLNLHGLRLKNLPKEMCCLTSLTELDLSNCNIVNESKLEAIFDGLGSLKILHLKDCDNLLELPVNIDSLSSLIELRLDGSNVMMLPTSIKNLSSLKILSLDNCKKLGCLPELSPHIIELNANNCISLVNVSSSKVLSKSMIGVKKYISFKNSMKLDEPSLNRIIKNVIFTMKNAAFHNTVSKYDHDYSYTYSSAEVCFPGSGVPRQFKFRTIGSSSSITVELPRISKCLGFILSAVVSPSYGMKEHGNCTIIRSKCYFGEGHQFLRDREITDLSLDHVLVWYDPYSGYFNDANAFEFSVTTITGEPNGFYSLKECGICPIYFSEFKRFVVTVDLVRHVEWDSALWFGSDTKSLKRWDDGGGGNSGERELGNEICCYLFIYLC